MTVSSTLNRTSLNGNNVTTTIPVVFPFQSAADLVVLLVVIASGVQITETLTTHYTITGTPDALGHYVNGGAVEMVTPPTTLQRVVVYRDPARTQSLDLVENDNLPAESLEAQLDYVTMLLQRVADLIGRALHQPEGDANAVGLLPSSVDRASKFLSFDSNGDPVAAAGTSANLGPVSAFINTLLDDANAATARATLGITVTSNKDDEFVVTGSADTSKKLAFEVDGVTTATTRTVTVQDLSGTMALQPTVAAYTGTASLAAGVGFARLSGASFTLTLPAVAVSTNRQVTIQHQGTSLTQVYNVKGNGAENIIGSDSTANTYLLYTKGEELTLLCDGASWFVTRHLADTPWTDAGAMTITGTTANPTKPTTPDIDKVYWCRDGNQVRLRYILQISSAAGSAGGTGNYLFALPTNIAFDTTILTPVGTPLTAALRSEASSSYLPSSAVSNEDSISYSVLSLFAYDTTHFQAWRTNANDAVGSSAAPLTSAELSYNFELSARAASWRV